MRATVLLLLAIGIATSTGAPLSAGVVYDFRTTMRTSRFEDGLTGRVWVDGDRYRAEITRPEGKKQIVISRDRDRNASFVDPEKKTWSNRVRIGTDVRSAALFRWPIGRPEVKGRPKVQYHASGAEPIAGHAAVEHRIETRFVAESSVDGTPVRGTFRLLARIWTAPDLPELPMETALRTGFPQIDEQLDRIAANVRGMVLRHELEVTRTLEGGPEQIEAVSTVVTTLEQTAIPETQFDVPESFTYVGPEAAVRN
jgi:hypothetical protein